MNPQQNRKTLQTFFNRVSAAIETLDEAEKAKQSGEGIRASNLWREYKKTLTLIRKDQVAVKDILFAADQAQMF